MSSWFGTCHKCSSAGGTLWLSVVLFQDDPVLGKIFNVWRLVKDIFHKYWVTLSPHCNESIMLLTWMVGLCQGTSLNPRSSARMRTTWGCLWYLVLLCCWEKPQWQRSATRRGTSIAAHSSSSWRLLLFGFRKWNKNKSYLKHRSQITLNIRKNRCDEYVVSEHAFYSFLSYLYKTFRLVSSVHLTFVVSFSLSSTKRSFTWQTVSVTERSWKVL